MTDFTAPALVQPVQQRVHKEFLTPAQLEEATKMGIKGLTKDNTQYDLIKLVNNSKTRYEQEHHQRRTDNFTKKLVKRLGRKRAKAIMIKRFDDGHIH